MPDILTIPRLAAVHSRFVDWGAVPSMAEPGSAHSCNTLVGGLAFLAEQVPPVGQSPRVPVFMSESQIAEVLTQMADSQVSKSTLSKLQKQFEEMKARRTRRSLKLRLQQ